MPVRATAGDVQAFLLQTKANLLGVEDQALQSALKTAEELVRVENETKTHLRTSDIKAAAEREGVAAPASSVMVMAYMAVKYPELAKSVSSISLKADLSRQFGAMMQMPIVDAFAPWATSTKKDEASLPDDVLRDLLRFVTPSLTTGKSLDDLFGGNAWFSGDRTVRIQGNVISVEGDNAFLVMKTKDSRLESVSFQKKTAAGTADEEFKLSELSPKALEQLSTLIAKSRQVPPKPEGALAARQWEAEHGAQKAVVDVVTGALTKQFRETRLRILNEAKTTTDDFAPALDAFFRGPAKSDEMRGLVARWGAGDHFMPDGINPWAGKRFSGPLFDEDQLAGFVKR